MDLLEWLFNGDVSIQYQVKRDLLGQEDIQLQKKIAQEGFGFRFMQEKHNNGYLGKGIYSPKWTSLHYTLFDLLWINIEPSNEIYLENVKYLLDNLWYKGKDKKNNRQLDLCISGMILHLLAYGNIKDARINDIVDYILETEFPDGGWNCMHDRNAKKSSLHTTLTVLEAFNQYLESGYIYRIEEIKEQVQKAEEFILRKELFKSERTKEIIKKSFLQFPFPSRWKYDYLRALDYFRKTNHKYDIRMKAGLERLKKAHKNGFFKKYSQYPGLTYFSMEDGGLGSRWNTLRALRVLKAYDNKYYKQLINQE